MAGSRVARAFAPGHVTGLFVPAQEPRDPRARGSVGAGIVLDIGAWATASWRAGPRRDLAVTDGRGSDLPISLDVARRLVGPRTGTLRVQLRHDLPIGQGFGMSAAGATATGLSVAAVLGVARAKAIEVAHLSELFGGGGLGGVAAILGGGIEFRQRAGIPPFGVVQRLAERRSLFVGIVGRPIASPRLLRDPRFLRRVGSGASRVRAALADPRAERFFRASERFTDRIGVATPRLHRVIHRLRAEGAWVFQPMFGNSFAAVPRDPARRAPVAERLRRLGVAAIEVGIAARGAHASRPGPLSRSGGTQPF